MTSEIFKNFEEKILGIEQVANLCCVSVERVKKWIEGGLLKSSPGLEFGQTRREDLVSFLMQYNKPIPDSILPVKAKKILFIFSSETLGYIYVSFLINFFNKLKTEGNYISDYISYGKNANYKILTFDPDLIINDTIGAFDDSLKVITYAKNICDKKILAIVEKKETIENIDKVKLAGADGVVERSIDINELIDHIRKLFN